MSKNDFLIEDGVLVEYLGSDDDVIIPKGVKCIGENAFEGSDLRSVVIPEGVVKIKSCAFYMCDSLRLVKFPGSIQKVDPSAFGDCYYLSEIHVLGHGDWFKKNIFRGTSPEIVVAPDVLCSVWNGFNLLHPAAVGYLKNMDAYTDDRIIDEYQNYIVEKKRKMLPIILKEDLVGGLEIFDDAGELTKKTIDSKFLDPAKELKSEQCIAFLTDWKNAHFTETELEKQELKKQSACDKKKDPYNATDMKKLWSYEKQEDGTFAITGYKGSETKIEVPERIGKTAVTAIAEDAFWDGKPRRPYRQRSVLFELTAVSLPNSITSIGERAFCNCTSLQTINIPKGVTKISHAAFWGCISLQSIEIPESVTEIDTCVFHGCSGLQTVNIPKGVTRIDSGAFSECRRLQTIRIPKSVTQIDNDVFDRTFKYYGDVETTIIAPAGSYAQKYAKEKKMPFVAE